MKFFFHRIIAIRITRQNEFLTILKMERNLNVIKCKSASLMLFEATGSESSEPFQYKTYQMVEQWFILQNIYSELHGVLLTCQSILTEWGKVERFFNQLTFCGKIVCHNMVVSPKFMSPCGWWAAIPYVICKFANESYTRGEINLWFYDLQRSAAAVSWRSWPELEPRNLKYLN